METTPAASLSNDEAADRRRLRRFAYLLIITLAGGLGAASIWRVEPLLSANDRSRWATVRALVEADTADPAPDNPFQIDNVRREAGWDSIDIVRHEGHFYSSKPPLLPWLVAWVYRGVNSTTDRLDGEPPRDEKQAAKERYQHDGWTLDHETAETARLILTIVNLVSWLLALLVVAAMVERYAERDFTRLFVVAAAALGTILSTFLVTLNNHLPAAVSVIFALYPAMRIVIDGQRKWWLFALAGFFAAFTCTNELPAALFGLAIFGLLLWKAPLRTIVFFGPAALVPLGAFFWTNYLATGGWKPFYFYYGTEKYNYVQDGVPSYWMHPGGLDANAESPWMYLLHCTVGHHGIFSLTPIFLISVSGWIGLAKWTNARLKPFLWMGLLLTLAIVGFYLSRTENYNYGGNTAGLRWTFWLIPFWLIAMVPALDGCFGRGGSCQRPPSSAETAACCPIRRSWQLRLRRWCRGFAVLLLGISTFSATYSLDNPWTAPWLYRVMQHWKWIDYRTPPEASPYKRPVTTWFGSLPESQDPRKPDWIRFEGFDTFGQRIELELRDGGMANASGQQARRVLVKWVRNGKPWKDAKYDVDPAAFNAGKDATRFLIAVDGESRSEAATFLRGLPRPRRYSVGKPDYLFTYLRRDAFKCWQAASRVPFAPPGSDRQQWYRCDTWLCEDLPFGVAQVRFRVGDGQSGESLSSLTLTVVKASRFPKSATEAAK
jgi:hypothetical protein